MAPASRHLAAENTNRPRANASPTRAPPVAIDWEMSCIRDINGIRMRIKLKSEWIRETIGPLTKLRALMNLPGRQPLFRLPFCSVLRSKIRQCKWARPPGQRLVPVSKRPAETSPALQRRGLAQVPTGRLRSRRSKRGFRRKTARAYAAGAQSQPSRQHFHPFRRKTDVETSGYSRLSLLDKNERLTIRRTGSDPGEGS